MRRVAASAVIVAGLLASTVAVAPAAQANDGIAEVIGRSAQGRDITAVHRGAMDAPVQLVVLGQMHGNEEGGRKVVRLLRDLPVPDGVGLWLVTTINPDGHEADARVNARGVDLNRNFPDRWREQRRGTDQWSGPRAASEPETRALTAFLERVRPTALLSYHQAYDLVDITHPNSRAAGRRLAAWMGERAASVPCSGPCHGTLTQWASAVLDAVAITVELDDRVSAAEARRAARAVLRLGTWLGR